MRDLVLLVPRLWILHTAVWMHTSCVLPEAGSSSPARHHYSTGHTYDRDKLQVCKEQMMKVVLVTQMTIPDTDDIVYHNGVRAENFRGFAIVI